MAPIFANFGQRLDCSLRPRFNVTLMLRFEMLLKAYVNNIKTELPHTFHKAAADLFEVIYVANEIRSSYRLICASDGPFHVSNESDGPVTHGIVQDVEHYVDLDGEYDYDAPDFCMYYVLSDCGRSRW